MAHERRDYHSEPIRIRPQDVTNALVGAPFPADLDRLADHARAAGAPDTVVAAIRTLPAERYSNLDDVMSAFHDAAERT